MSGSQQNRVAKSRCSVLQLLPASGEVGWEPGSLQDLWRDDNHGEGAATGLGVAPLL